MPYGKGRFKGALEGVSCEGGGVKQGRFVILRFPLFCSVWGFQDTQMLGKTARYVTKKARESPKKSKGLSLRGTPN